MSTGFKYAWITFTICCFIAVLFSLIPIKKMQKSYMSEFHRLKNEPQRRVEETYKYIEALEEGNTNISVTKFYENLLKTDNRAQRSASVKPVRKYSKPLYVRDRKNPNIIRPYRTKRPLFFE